MHDNPLSKREYSVMNVFVNHPGTKKDYTRQEVLDGFTQYYITNSRKESFLSDQLGKEIKFEFNIEISEDELMACIGNLTGKGKRLSSDSDLS